MDLSKLTAPQLDELEACSRGLPFAESVEAERASRRRVDDDLRQEAIGLGHEFAEEMMAGGASLRDHLKVFWVRFEKPNEVNTLVYGTVLRSLIEKKCRAVYSLVGRAYESGTFGFERNEVLAFEWFQRAARSGSDDGPTWLGRAYELGIGTEPDIEQAIHWYDIGSKLCCMLATVSLARIYHARKFLLRSRNDLAEIHETAMVMYDLVMNRLPDAKYVRPPALDALKSYHAEYGDWSPETPLWNTNIPR